MTVAEALARMEPIVRDLFAEYTGPVTPTLSAHDVEQWDSLSNIKLIIMVEKEFRVTFAAGEISALENLGGLAQLVVAKSA